MIHSSPNRISTRGRSCSATVGLHSSAKGADRHDGQVPLAVSDTEKPRWLESGFEAAAHAGGHTVPGGALHIFMLYKIAPAGMLKNGCHTGSVLGDDVANLTSRN